MEEEDVRRIVRKSLEPEQDDTMTFEDDTNETDIPESSDPPLNNENTQTDDDAEALNQMIDEALYEIRNFVPTRKQREQPMFVDLSVEDEKRIRTKNRGAPYYWHMPFRHDLFLTGLISNEIREGSSDEEDAKISESKTKNFPNKR